MTYNQQARALLDELNLHGKLTTEHYSMIEAGLNELDARAEEAERKVDMFEKMAYGVCKHCVNAQPSKLKASRTLTFLRSCKYLPEGTLAATSQHDCEHWQFDYERFKGKNNDLPD